MGGLDPLLAVPCVETVPGVPLFDELPADGPLASVTEEADWPGLVEPDGVVDVGLPGDVVELLEEVFDEGGVVCVPLVVVVDVLPAEPDALAGDSLRLAPPLVGIAAPPVARSCFTSAVAELIEVLPDSPPAVPDDEESDPLEPVPGSDWFGKTIVCDTAGAVCPEPREESDAKTRWCGAGAFFVAWPDAL